MLTLIDLGCGEHESCQVILNGSEASMLEDILRNLPRDGECRTYVCGYGQTHYLSFRCCKGRINQH